MSKAPNYTFLILEKIIANTRHITAENKALREANSLNLADLETKREASEEL